MDFEINHTHHSDLMAGGYENSWSPEVKRSQIIDRCQTGLPGQFVPLARGALIANDNFLNRTDPPSRRASPARLEKSREPPMASD